MSRSVGSMLTTKTSVTSYKSQLFDLQRTNQLTGFYEGALYRVCVWAQILEWNQRLALRFFTRNIFGNTAEVVAMLRLRLIIQI